GVDHGVVGGQPGVDRIHDQLQPGGPAPVERGLAGPGALRDRVHRHGRVTVLGQLGQDRVVDRLDQLLAPASGLTAVVGHEAGLRSPAAVTRPVDPSTLISGPGRSRRVPSPVPMTAGRPYSRATIAAWEPTPPVSATTAAARWNRGVQAGLV